MSFAIAGKTAIVTGAANGIGRAIARHFTEKGANVVFADMDEKGLIEEVGEQPEDSNIRYFAGDMRERLAVANLLSTTLDAFDQVDILDCAEDFADFLYHLKAMSDREINDLKLRVQTGHNL